MQYAILMHAIVACWILLKHDMLCQPDSFRMTALVHYWPAFCYAKAALGNTPSRTCLAQNDYENQNMRTCLLGKGRRVRLRTSPCLAKAG